VIRRRRGIQRKKKQDRYGVQKFEAYGESFRSKLEFAVRNLLKMREAAGEIEMLNREDHVRLGPARFLYIPDFKCRDIKTNEIFWVEAKGKETETWRRNYRLWKIHGPGRLEIWKGNAAAPKLVEILIPRADVCPSCGRPLLEAPCR